MAWKKNSYAKYRNNSQTCHQGHKHHSAGEAGYCDELHLLLKAGEIKEIEQQKSFTFVVNGKTICRHIPDFLVTENDGSKAVHEYKGFADKVWPIKKKLFEALYPEIPYIVIPHRQRKRDIKN